MSILRWSQFGEYVVKEMAKVQPGENLLILGDTWTDMDILNACMIAGMNLGAKTDMYIIPRMDHTCTDELSDMAEAAFCKADVIVAMCETMFVEKQATKAARKTGTRIVSTIPRGMEDFAIDGTVSVDYPGLIELSRKIAAKWSATKNCRVTSELGTDISFSMVGRPTDVGDGIADKPGECDFFPGPDVNIAPIESTINGTIVVDGCIEPGSRLVKSPMTLKIEKGLITSIEGGQDANMFREALASVHHPAAYALCHYTLGMNPVAVAGNSMHETEHIFGAVTFGFGDQDPAFQGTVGEAPIHSDVVCLSPTIYLDGEVLIAKNKLNPNFKLD